MLQADLIVMVARYEHKRDEAKEEGLGEADVDRVTLNLALSRHRRISPGYSGYVATVAPIDGKLAAHLFLIGEMHSTLDVIIDRLDKNYQHMKANDGQCLYPKKVIEDDRESYPRHAKLMCEHAKCAIYLLDGLASGSHFRKLWLRFRRRFAPTDIDRKSKELLSGRLD